MPASFLSEVARDAHLYQSNASVRGSSHFLGGLMDGLEAQLTNAWVQRAVHLSLEVLIVCDTNEHSFFLLPSSFLLLQMIVLDDESAVDCAVAEKVHEWAVRNSFEVIYLKPTEVRREGWLCVLWSRVTRGCSLVLSRIVSWLC